MSSRVWGRHFRAMATYGAAGDGDGTGASVDTDGSSAGDGAGARGRPREPPPPLRLTLRVAPCRARTTTRGGDGRASPCIVPTDTVASSRTWRVHGGTIMGPDRHRRARERSVRGRTRGPARYGGWRRGRDSNPRYIAIHTLSKRAPSTTRSPLQGARRSRTLRERPPRRAKENGGEGGIRTHGERKPTVDFESTAFDHSATSPQQVQHASGFRRRARKKLRSCSAAPASRTPEVTSKRWLSRGCRDKSASVPRNPPLGSDAA